MDIAASAGETALQRNGSAKLDAAAKLRLRAYIHQARQYYEAVSQADPVAKPLLGYYFVLNAAKAFLTALDQTKTAPIGLAHGIGQANNHLSLNYEFDQEYFSIRGAGVFQHLAAATGRGHVWHVGELQLTRLMRYLPESADLFSSALEKRPALLPIEEVRVLSAGKRPSREAWLVVEISRLALNEADLSPRKLLSSAAAFASAFELVTDSSSTTATYQLRRPIAYAAMPGALKGLRDTFDQSLIARNRIISGGRDSIVISPHVELVSSEALTFAIMLHLSNIVRYRPHHAEELRGGNYWWLFTSWVDRACENFLLSVSSRISLEEHVIS